VDARRERPRRASTTTARPAHALHTWRSHVLRTTRAHHGDHCAGRSLRQRQSGAAGRTVAVAGAFASSVTRTGARAAGRSCLDSDQRCHARKSRVQSWGAERDGGHNRHLDEHRHGDAHLLVRCAGMGLGRNRSGRSVLVRVSSGRDVPLSLRDSSGDGRKGRRPLTFMSTYAFINRLFRRTQWPVTPRCGAEGVSHVVER
jgi:hypothetical protein